MLYSEKLDTFDERRDEFSPYGLTCELWMPDLMRKPDRHNEIEINFITQGSITYLFHGKRITIPANSLALFWGLVPHQIIEHTNLVPYYVCTIPFSIFLEWKLPGFFVDNILKGEILIEETGDQSFIDEFIIGTWFKDYSKKQNQTVILLEMHARLLRMAERIAPLTQTYHSVIDSNEISKVEQIAFFIAQNYRQPIKASDIKKSIGLHPDYANVIFKKAFGITINEYMIQERISHAQRKLISTNKSITDILYDSGFNSISRFNAAFRKINKCTPREFRKKHQYQLINGN